MELVKQRILRPCGRDTVYTGR